MENSFTKLLFHKTDRKLILTMKSPSISTTFFQTLKLIPDGSLIYLHDDKDTPAYLTIFEICLIFLTVLPKLTDTYIKRCQMAKHL